MSRKNYIAWTLKNGTLTISGNGPMKNYGFGGAPWYSSRESITAIVVKDGVTSIGDSAFAVCMGLTSVIISNSVTEIGESAFFKCKHLTSVVIPNSVTKNINHFLSVVF